MSQAWCCCGEAASGLGQRLASPLHGPDAIRTPGMQLVLSVAGEPGNVGARWHNPPPARPPANAGNMHHDAGVP